MTTGAGLAALLIGTGGAAAASPSLLAPAAAGLFQERSGPTDGWAERLERSAELRELVGALRSLRDPRADKSPERAAALRAAASGHLRDLLEILHAARVPALDPEQEEPQILSEPQRQFTLALLQVAGRARALGALTQALTPPTGPDPDAAWHVVAVRVLGAVGRASDVDALLEHAAAAGETRAALEATRTGIEQLVRSDPGTIDWLDRRRSRVSSALLPEVVLGLGAAGDARALLLLCRIALRDRELSTTCLTQIAALGPSESRDANALVRETVRGFLDADALMLRRASMSALGALADAESVPLLAAAMAAETRGERSDAAGALRALSGLALRDEQAAWEDWYENEVEWFEDEGRGHLARLASPELEQISDAVRQLSPHRLHRLRIAAALEECLLDGRAEVRRIACAALAQLGTAESAPALRELQKDFDRSVREAATAALEAVQSRPQAAAAGPRRLGVSERPALPSGLPQ